MNYGETSHDDPEGDEYKEMEKEVTKRYRNSLLPHMRFDVKVPDTMSGMGGGGLGFNVPDTGKMVPVKIHDSTPWKTRIPKSGKRY